MGNNKLKITETLFVAITPISAYFIAYVFERGYARFYKIPTLYIDISIINVISTFIALVSTYALIFLFFDSLIYPTLSKANRTIRLSIIKITLITLSLVGFGIVFNWSLTTSFILILPIITFLLFLEFGFPLLTQKNTIGYLNKIEAQKETDFKDEHFLDSFVKKYGIQIFRAIIIFYFISIASYIAGGYSARFKTEHITSIKNPNIVYLRKYGELLIGNKFDRKTNKLSNEFIIEKTDVQSIKIETIGKLEPYESKKPNKKVKNVR